MEMKQHAIKQPMDKRESQNHLETNESENTTFQNLWDAEKQF